MDAKKYSEIILVALEQGVSGKLKTLVQEIVGKKAIHKYDVTFEYHKEWKEKLKSQTIEILDGYTNSKLSKIVKEIENQKATVIHYEPDEEIWNDGLDRAIEIVKKEIAKKD